MKNYEVTVPIAGFACKIVKARNKKEAVQKAIRSITMKNIESWNPLERFDNANFSYCPTKAEAIEH